MSLWRLAWQRFARDRVGVASLAVVLAFVALAAASAAGLVAGDWSREVAVSYAPPGFLGREVAEERAAEAATRSQDDYGIVDPLHCQEALCPAAMPHHSPRVASGPWGRCAPADRGDKPRRPAGRSLMLMAALWRRLTAQGIGGPLICAIAYGCLSAAHAGTTGPELSSWSV